MAVLLLLAGAAVAFGYDAVNAWIRHNQFTASLGLAVAYLLWDVHVLEQRVAELEAKKPRLPPI